MKKAKENFLLCEMEFNVKVATINFVFIEYFQVYERDLIWYFHWILQLHPAHRLSIIM